MSDDITEYKNWKCDTDDNKILWLSICTEKGSVNTLGRPVLEELATILDEIEKTNPKAVVLQSDPSKKGFIAGADIEAFTKLQDYDETFELVRMAQEIFNRVAGLKMPTIALISGFCMGGGCELSLACDYRIADKDDASKTLIGLPEVMLGIQPGWGGSVRLPRLVGVLQAMGLMLTGRAIKASAAKRMGLVDEAVAKRELKRAAITYALKPPKKHKPGKLADFLAVSFMRPLVGKLLYRQLAKKHVNINHYPAPFAMVRQWVSDGGQGKNAFVHEAESISKLLITETSRNLVRVFFLQNQMKALAKGSDFSPQRVHVIGAGTMGGDIAAWCALKGMVVTLQDRAPEYIAPAMKRAHALFKKKLKKPNLISQAMDRLQADPSGRGVSSADVIIEAIFENLEAKQELFKSMEGKIKPTAIFATNTSSIPLDEINVVLDNPERLVGIHFFNPVAKMQLVEVVRGEKTTDDIMQRAQAFVGKISRLPLPVKSSPGFLVNRILMPYLMESMSLLDEGVEPEVVDKIALKFGMPMGPARLADQVGLDVCLSVADNLTQHLGGVVPAKLRVMVEKGELGCKSGQGFYKYEKGKVVKSSTQVDMSSANPDISDRLILIMLNEAAKTLREGVINNDDLLDGGIIFGTGFAPFRGGPINYAKTRGVSEIVTRLNELAEKYGDRFKADEYWQQLLPKAENVAEKPSDQSGKSASSKPESDETSETEVSS